jgi:methanogenic corrinoid protein MtbC1
MSKGFSKGPPDSFLENFPTMQRATEDESGELARHDGGTRSDLLATIHEQIVPRLMLAHAPEVREVNEANAVPLAVDLDTRAPVTAAEVAELARLAADEDFTTALAFVERLTAEGLVLETILLDLLAPAARLLGIEWEEDERSFTEVTTGLGTIQQIVNVLGPKFERAAVDRGYAVLVGAPGEQHTLGLHLVGELLRRAGWSVHVAPSMSESDLLELVASEGVDVVGFSISNENLLKPLARTIAAVKKSTMNPAMLVMLGGASDLSQFAAKVGATFCGDARLAVRWLDLRSKLDGSRQKC